MPREIQDISVYPKNKKQIRNDIAQKCNKNSIFDLPFNQLCEAVTLVEILSEDNQIIKTIKKKFSMVTFCNSKGVDICFSDDSKGNHLRIEIKGSRLKSDYMNKNGYNKKIKFWGNGIKLKDFNQNNGLLVADILILVCCSAGPKEEIDENTKWSFEIFNNDDIQNLEPKTTVFLPAYCITTMVQNKNSYFTDEYSGLHKGLVQIIKYKKTGDDKMDDPVRKDFMQVWENVDCFLYQKEHKKIVQNIWDKNHTNNWDKIVSIKNTEHSGKFKLRKLIKSHKCGIVSMPDNPTHKENCIKCINLLSNFKGLE